MDKKRYFAGKLKPGTLKFRRSAKKYGPLPEKVVEAPVEEAIKAVEEVEKPKKAKKKVKRTTKKKTEE